MVCLKYVLFRDIVTSWMAQQVEYCEVITFSKAMFS